MKTLPSGLAAHVAGGTTTLAYLLTITRKDGAVYAFTSASTDVVVGNLTYLSVPGLNVSNLVHSEGLSVDNLELSTLDDGTIFTLADALDGKWSEADFLLSRHNYTSTSSETEPLMAGTVGNISVHRGYIVVELRGLQQKLQQRVGAVCAPTCRARFGDSLCRVPLATYTYSGSITAVADNNTFTDSTKTQAAAWFDNGTITFTSGPLNGTSWKIKAFAGGVFTLSLTPFQTVGVGNTFTVIAGCTKRLAEDCGTKFNNVVNFQGEPHLPGIDAVSQPFH